MSLCSASSYLTHSEDNRLEGSACLSSVEGHGGSVSQRAHLMVGISHTLSTWNWRPQTWDLLQYFSPF